MDNNEQPWPTEAELTPPTIVEGEFTELPPEGTVEPEPEPEPPTFSREDAEQVLRDLRSELFSLRGNVSIMARDLKEAEAYARQCATDLDHGGVKLTRDQLVKQEMEAHRLYREMNPNANQGDGSAFLRKQLRYGRRRVPTMPDGTGGLSLAKMPDGSYVQPMPRERMDLRNRPVRPVTK